MRDNMTAKLFEALHEVNEDSFGKNKKSILEMTTSEVIEEEVTEDKSYKMCPRCGRPYSDYPAISRYDDKTEICPDCGVEEAMINYTGGTLEAPNKYKDEARKYNKDNSKRVSEEVTIDTPTQEDLDRDEENTKAMNKKDIEDRIGELRLAIEDGAISNDEREAVRKEISELESQLNENTSFKRKKLKEGEDTQGALEAFSDGLTEAIRLQDLRNPEEMGEFFQEAMGILRSVAEENGYMIESVKTKKLDESEDAVYNHLGERCPKCGSGNYFEVDGAEYDDGTQEFKLVCADCGYESSTDELNHNDLNEAEEVKEESNECEDKKKVSDAKSFDEVIDLLVSDEEEAIEGYNEAIEKLKELDEKEKEKLIDMLSHIRDEEREHIDELENREIEEHE